MVAAVVAVFVFALLRVLPVVHLLCAARRGAPPGGSFAARGDDLTISALLAKVGALRCETQAELY